MAHHLKYSVEWRTAYFSDEVIGDIDLDIGWPGKPFQHLQPQPPPVYFLASYFFLYKPHQT